jgi:hypothetical protein
MSWALDVLLFIAAVLGLAGLILIVALVLTIAWMWYAKRPD